MSKEEFIEKIKEIKINVPDEDFFLEYSKEVHNLLDDNEKLNRDYYNLKSRIDKAIEYLKKNACYDEKEKYFNDFLPEICCKPLLKILEGGSNE